MNKRTSVVIPIYDNWNLTHQTLFDLYKNCRDSIDELLIVNDASTQDTVYEGLAFWKKEGLLPITELRLKENKHFLKASNIGMNRATGDILVLLSNDVRVYGDFCKETKEILSDGAKHLVGGRLLNFDTGWNVFDGRMYQYLEGWLLACTKDAWKELGGFDERFAPHDYEDIDISTTALDKGYSLVELSGGQVNHLGGQSIGFNTERESITNKNREKFREKWIR